MSNLTLYLLRHGESQANVDRIFAARRINPPLTAQGIWQANIQAKALKDIDFSRIYSSPLLRTQHTAKIINEWHGIDIEISDHLYEVDVGILDGKSQNDPNNWSAYQEIINKWGQRLTDASFPDGESLNDVNKRFMKFIDELKADDHKPILVVGHCVLFMSIFWSFCENCGTNIESNNMKRGHLSIISGNKNKFNILKFNVFPEK